MNSTKVCSRHFNEKSRRNRLFLRLGIHQQILEDQSAQNGNNTNDSTADGVIPRARSSITRSILLNPGRKANEQISWFSFVYT